MDVMSQRIKLDVRRMLCPLPVIKVQGLASNLEPGDEIEVICTDPGVQQDIPAWCRINGHRVLENKVQGSEYILLIKIGGVDASPRS